MRGWGDVHAGGESCALAGEGLTLEQLRHCLSVLISARQDVEVQQKDQFVLWYAELKSVMAVQRKWRSLHPGEKPPTEKALNRFMNQFKETGTVEKQKSTGRPRTTEEDVEGIRQSCIRSPKNQFHVEA